MPTVRLDRIDWARPYGVSRRVSSELDTQVGWLAEKIASATRYGARASRGVAGRSAGAVARVSVVGSRGAVAALRQAGARSWM